MGKNGQKKPPKLELPPAPPEERPKLLAKGEVMPPVNETDMHVPAKVDNRGDAVVFDNITVAADPLKRVPIADPTSVSQSSFADFSGNFGSDYSQGSERKAPAPQENLSKPSALSYEDPTCSGVNISVQQVQRALKMETEERKEKERQGSQPADESSPLVPGNCLPHPQYCCPLMRFGSTTSDQINAGEHADPRGPAPSQSFSEPSSSYDYDPNAPGCASPSSLQSPTNGKVRSGILLEDLDAADKEQSEIAKTAKAAAELYEKSQPAAMPPPPPKTQEDERRRQRSHRSSDPQKERRRRESERSGEPTQHIHFKDLALKERIGNGAYGVVTRCIHKDGTTYALKTVTVSDDAKRMLRSELERLKQRRAEFTVHTYEAYYSKSAKTVHFLMEYLANGSVGRCFLELRSRKRNMHRSDIALIAERVLLALNQLRKQHIIHKDIKPDNILIGLRSQVKIGDFGICAFANQNSEAISVGTGSYSRWMAPERISSDCFSYNSDVYSLGFVVAYLALGRFPLSLQSCRDIIFMVDGGNNLDLSSLQGPANEHLVDFIYLATRHTKSERPDAEELLRHPFITQRNVPPKCEDKNTLSFLRHIQPLIHEHGDNRLYNRYTDSASGTPTSVDDAAAQS